MDQLLSSLQDATWNVRAFDLLHATASSPTLLVETARLVAQWGLYPVVLITAWQLWRRRDIRHTLQLISAWLVTAGIEAWISAVAPQPRPFAAGFGPAWLEHAANNSMPSSHVTVGCLLVITLIQLHRTGSAWLAACIVAALAWSRVCTGIHWPSDMLGALVSALLSTCFVSLTTACTMRVDHYLKPRQIGD